MYFNYEGQILVFQLFDNSANKHADQPRFFCCLPAAKYTKLCMAWQPNIRQNAVPPPNPTPLEFSSEPDDISVEIWLRLQNYFGINPKNYFVKL